MWAWIVIAIVVVGGGYWLWSSNSAMPASTDNGTQITDTGVPTDSGTQTPPSDTSTTGSSTPSTGAPMTATITYDGNSFSPSNVTIAQGGTVTWTDTSGSRMWVATAPHPVHTGYDGTDRQTHCAAGYTGAAPFDQCKGGSSFSFTFTKSGTWPYHDHMNPGAFGSVTVQ